MLHDLLVFGIGIICGVITFQVLYLAFHRLLPGRTHGPAVALFAASITYAGLIAALVVGLFANDPARIAAIAAVLALAVSLLAAFFAWLATRPARPAV